LNSINHLLGLHFQSLINYKDKDKKKKKKKKRGGGGGGVGVVLQEDV
jgi:hypothetical protein